MRIFAMLLSLASSVLLAQTQSGGTIQGTVTDDQNQGVPAAIVTIHRTFATNAKAAPYSRTMKTASDGSFVAAGLPPGTYAYCAQAGDGILNGCHWNPPAVNLTLAAGQKLRVIIRVTKGSILKVRVVDPVGLGIKSSADQKDLPILMGVWDHHGHFLPVHLTNTKGATRDYQLTVPFDTPLSFQVHSPKVKLSEQGGGALPAAANAAARAASGLNQPSPPQVHRSQSKGIILDRMEL